ncbi:hypothetical protein ACFLTD_04055, partial [Elusimicrobiota bacterium]
VLIFGDAKCYYIRKKFIASSPSGLNPLIEFARQAKSADRLHEYMSGEGITHILINMPEAVRTGNYGNLYFSSTDLKIFDDYWRSYVKEVYRKDGLYLYELVAFQNGASSENILKEIYNQYSIKKASKYMNRKDWSKAALIFEESIEKGL